MNRSRILPFFILLIVISVSATSLLAQEQGEKKPVPIEDYGRWRSITSTAISDDGNWVCFAYRKREADDSLYVKNIETQKEYLVSLASGARFSDDSRWIAYMLTVPWKQAEKLQEDKKPVPRKAELMNLETGEKMTWENVNSFSFNKGSTHLAVRKQKTNTGAKHNGTDLILRNLRDGYEELIGSVSALSFNKPGGILAYTVETADKDGNGLYIIILGSGSRRPLDNDRLVYARMTWDEEGTALAVLKGDEKKGFDKSCRMLLA